MDRFKNSRSYYFNRFLRIYPELWVGVAIEAVCIVIFVLPIHWGDLILFIGAQATILQFWTPDSLRSFGCGTPNGSLWTICVIVQFYIIVWALKKLCKKKRPLFWIVTEIILMMVGAATQYLEALVPEIIYKLYCQTIIQYLWIFWLGMFIAEYRDKIVPILMRFWYIPTIGAILMRFSPIDIWSRGFPIILSCLCLTSLLGIAYKLPRLKISTDISYALFIYHMIVVNVMLELNLSEKVTPIIGCIIVSLVLAYISTTLIGKKAGKLRV